MFAVPGWSVSSDALKTEKLSAGGGTEAAGNGSGSKSKKRKRPGKDARDSVTASNVAELYESVVEGKKPNKKHDAPSKQDQSAKRQKKDGNGKPKDDDTKTTTADSAKVKKDEGGKQVEQKPSKGGETQPPTQTKKDKKKNKKNKQGNQPSQEATTEPKDDTTTSLTPQPLTPAPPKLTPLQASMREKLVSARFRHLNETLYTRPSEEAYQLFHDSPEMFGEYHEGFRRQVKVWPENPVDSFLADIRTRGKARPPGKGRPGAPPTPLSKTVLPRTVGTCIIADLGCGDARLAESLRADGGVKKLKLDVRSYDLQSPSPLVTKADIANLPLEDGSVNVAVFCLALMGTNWVDFVEEAYRILHWKGELWVAEIKSRFGPVRSKNAPVSHSVGNRKKAVGKKAKGQDPAEEKVMGEDLAVEVDGIEDRRRETDVSAFVEVLRKRGFVLQGDREAVDLSNKMFVKMHFIKGAAPTKGKGVKPEESNRGKKGVVRWPGPDDVDDEEKNEVSEASVLKPCVYKLR